MPVKKSAHKELRKAKKRTAHNLIYKRNLEYLTRQFKKAFQDKSAAQLKELSNKIIKAIDKMAQKGILKKNTAARRKSRLMAKVNSLTKE
ncbi:MAG TPA: 30S ribosomal protein S20 [Patescibacteria group bacterium]